MHSQMQQRLKSDFNIFDDESVAAIKGGFVGGLNVFSMPAMVVSATEGLSGGSPEVPP